MNTSLVICLILFTFTITSLSTNRMDRPPVRRNKCRKRYTEVTVTLDTCRGIYVSKTCNGLCPTSSFYVFDNSSSHNSAVRETICECCVPTWRRQTTSTGIIFVCPNGTVVVRRTYLGRIARCRCSTCP